MDGRRKGMTTAAGSSSEQRGGAGGSGSSFQMPLHYPRYTKEEYKELPEWLLDHLLAQYGLSAVVHRDLESKREYAMGAFLWPEKPPSQPSTVTDANNHGHATNPNSASEKNSSGFASIQSFWRKKRV